MINDDYNIKFTDQELRASSKAIMEQLGSLMLEEIRFIHSTRNGPNAECWTEEIKTKGADSKIQCNKAKRYAFKIKAMLPDHAEWAEGYYERWKNAALVEIYSQMHKEVSANRKLSEDLFSQVMTKIKSPEEVQENKLVEEEPKAYLANPALEITFDATSTFFGNNGPAIDMKKNSLKSILGNNYAVSSALTNSGINGSSSNSSNQDNLVSKLDNLIAVITPVLLEKAKQAQATPKKSDRISRTLKQFRRSRMLVDSPKSR